MPKRERYLFVCTNERPAGDPRGSCARQGSREILNDLKKTLNSKGLGSKIRVCGATCLDLCWAGVAIGVEPDNVFYGRVTPGDVSEIAEALSQNQIVDRLVLAANEFDDPAKKSPA